MSPLDSTRLDTPQLDGPRLDGTDDVPEIVYFPEFPDFPSPREARSPQAEPGEQDEHPDDVPRLASAPRTDLARTDLARPPLPSTDLPGFGIPHRDLPRKVRPPRPPARVGRRTAAALALAAALAAGGIAAATVSTADDAHAVRADLDRASTVAAGIARLRAPLEVEELSGRLRELTAISEAVERRRTGLDWRTARWSTRSVEFTVLQNRAAGLAALAEAGRPLATSLPAATSGDIDPVQLERLAGDLDRYTRAARDSGIVTDGRTPQLAEAAGRLAALTGTRQSWTTCPSSDPGPQECTLMVVDRGKVAERRDVQAPSTSPGDVVVTGASAEDLTDGERLSAPKLLNLLLRSADSQTKDSPTARILDPLVAR